MQLKQFLDDDRAVSPVIGVILMVAITVILAAVIGTFVLGLGDQVSQTTPSASFQFDYDRDDTAGDELVIAHNGGDTLNANEVNITITGGNVSTENQSKSWSDYTSDSDVSAGSSVTLDNSTTGDASWALELQEATVRVVWQAAEGDSSAQLGRWSGPEA